MNFEEYRSQFEEILSGRIQSTPYDNSDFLEYVKLNHSRMNRWEKKGELIGELKKTISDLNQPQKWVLITEPWCGDAANITPFIQKMSTCSDNIELVVQNRDSETSEINNYLTNGGKSIPILIVRDADGKDLFTWGPRPTAATEIVLAQKLDATRDAKEKKAELQNWYNENKGEMIQEEILQQLRATQK